MRVTKVKSDGKLVLGYSMARRKSRVSIELGVQIGLEGRWNENKGDEMVELRLKDFQNLPLESIRQGFEPTPRLNIHEWPKIESIRLASGGAGKANDSAYGNSGPSGVVSDCGDFVSTWDKD
ncbi:hypothetical protein PIB30_069191 [Stylosanthes scabra]|uniref:Uncharacterized protein n=1 Tax=Stylosanthes scabra TaxID=79078 RepID=A0ABU6YMI2_9FABA|nr:hypothetical protein [Stylosanthes scabra]